MKLSQVLAGATLREALTPELSGLEAAGLDAIVVSDDCDTWYARSAFPEVCLHPIVGRVCRFEEKNVSRHTPLSLGH